MSTAFSTPIATSMSTTRDSIASVDSIDFKVSVQIDGQFNDPVITFPQGDNFLELTAGYYNQKLGQTETFANLANRYLNLMDESIMTDNKSLPLKILNDMEITVEEYKHSKLMNIFLLLLSLSIAGGVYLYNLNIVHRTFEHMKLFQIGIVQLFFSSILFGLLYLSLSLIFNHTWLLLR